MFNGRAFFEELLSGDINFGLAVLIDFKTLDNLVFSGSTVNGEGKDESLGNVVASISVNGHAGPSL